MYQDKRMNVEGDRLSNLPDELIHKILSFISIKQAIETSVLSSRWRYIWTSMPYLSFAYDDFCYPKLVTHVLSRRNNQTNVHTVNLDFCVKDDQQLVQSILDYAFSHNVQRLSITSEPEKNIEFPFSSFSSQSLKHLTLTGHEYRDIIMTPPTWELPALITLNLCHVTLHDENTVDMCVGLFSNYANLKNLTLKNCRLDGLSICHPGLSNLTLLYGSGRVNLATPQLKNLTIDNWGRINLISAPNLFSLHYKHYFYPMELSADLPNLEKVDICIPSLSVDKKNAHKIVPLLQRVSSVKFLTLNLEIIEFLSSSVELISHQPSPFTNLKSLKIYPVDERAQPKVMSTEVKRYLLNSSPGATFTMVSHEEIRALKNVATAQRLMREFQVVLDQLKEGRETNTIDTAQPGTEMKCQVEERMTHIENYWESMNKHMEKVYENADRAISWLGRIKRVLTMLPASSRDKLQARFSGLCVEADAIMDNMMDHLKIEGDKKPRFKSLVS